MIGIESGVSLSIESLKHSIEPRLAVLLIQPHLMQERHGRGDVDGNVASLGNLHARHTPIANIAVVMSLCMSAHCLYAGM